MIYFDKMFTDSDLLQIKDKNISIEDVEKQLENFKKGFAFINITSAATVGNGIFVLSKDDREKYLKFFDENIEHIKVQKFVPASGAATRMFKSLFEFLNLCNENCEQTIKKYKLNEVQKTLNNLNLFAFYDSLKKVINANGLDINILLKQKKYRTIIEYILFEKGLNYAHFPKGLIKFHKYDTFTRNPLSEHLYEAVSYTNNEQVYIHFTIPPNHKELFINYINNEKKYLETEHCVKYMVSCFPTK